MANNGSQPVKVPFNMTIFSLPFTCEYMGASVRSKGLFRTDNPLKYPLPLLMLQLGTVIIISTAFQRLLRPLKQPRFVSDMLVIYDLSFFFHCQQFCTSKLVSRLRFVCTRNSVIMMWLWLFGNYKPQLWRLVWNEGIPKPHINFCKNYLRNFCLYRITLGMIIATSFSRICVRKFIYGFQKTDLIFFFTKMNLEIWKRSFSNLIRKQS